MEHDRSECICRSGSDDSDDTGERCHCHQTEEAATATDETQGQAYQDDERSTERYQGRPLVGVCLVAVYTGWWSIEGGVVYRMAVYRGWYYI